MGTELETVVGGRKRFPLWLKCVIGLVVLSFLYFLSFGPVHWMETRGHLKNHRRMSWALSLFYKPMFLVYNHTPLRGPIERYVRLWDPPHREGKPR
jgi:hypothetical protein